MKILLIAPYITSDKHPSFLRNKTGFGMMVYDIAKHIGEYETVDLLAVNTFAPAIQMDGFKTIQQSPSSILRNFSISSFFDSFKFLRKYSVPMVDKLRIIYQHLSVGALSRIIRNYDVVHIHGCGPITNATIKLCIRKKIPFCITLHGLVSFEKEVRLHESLKQYERDFLKEAYSNDYAVSFISTGNFEQAMDYAKSH